MGEDVKPQPRDRKTKRFKKSGARKLAIALLVVFGFVGSYFTIGTYAEDMSGKLVDAIADSVLPQAYASNGVDSSAIADVIVGNRVDALKDALVDELAAKENGDGSALPAYVDDNKAGSLSRKDKVSYGCMSYKISTVQSQYQTLYGKSLSNLDAVLLALDCGRAKSLAKDAIFKLPGALWNWSAATQEMATRVEVIRSLEN